MGPFISDLSLAAILFLTKCRRRVCVFIFNLALSTICLLVSLDFGHAEYRLFQLNIVSPSSGKETTVVSNLDDLQYRTYNALHAQDQVVLVNSWMCYGSTSDHTPYCPNPKPEASATSPTTPTPQPLPQQ